MAATVISFGEWLPDQPALNNPGLTEANNVIATPGHYRPYQPLVSAGFNSTLPAQARGAFYAIDATFGPRLYAGTAESLYMQTATSMALRTGASLTSNTIFDWQFCQYRNIVFAANKDNTMFHTVGAATNFATSAAPKAFAVGSVGQFVVVGQITDASSTARPSTIRWSAVDDPTNWPTPNSATAIATQAGEQELNSAFGSVHAIVGGDQFGLIFQDNGITRMTYVGPPVVFQFDEISESRGSWLAQSVVKAGNVTYFLAADGPFVTDGVSTKQLGEGKVDRTFVSGLLTGGAITRGVFNQATNCVFWSFADTATTVANRVFSYNIDTGWFTRANQQLACVETSNHGAIYGPYAYNTSNVLCSWNSTATAQQSIGTATIATGDIELIPGGRAHVDGIKPNIESSGTAPAITVRVGSRNDLATTPSYTATTTPTTRTGYADFRVDAKYHRAEVQIVGNFEKASGLVVKAFGSGET
jgi:hypothetical protein